MVLVLSIIRCPDRAVPEERRVQGGEYVLGRGADCDWVLSDPDRVLSKRHCAVEFLAGHWQVRDLSANGTFLNSAGDPVGRDRTGPIRDGDRLRLGAYEIECRVEDEAVHGSGRWQSARAIPDPMRPGSSSDIFSAPLPGLSPPAGGTPGGHAPLLPADFDPFAPEDPGPVMPDHRPSTSDVFTPPRATMPDLLPDDWAAPPKAPARPEASAFDALPDPFADAPPLRGPAPPSPQSQRLDDPFAALPTPPPAQALPDPFAASVVDAPVAAPVTAPIDARLPDPFADLGLPASPPQAALSDAGPFVEVDVPPIPALFPAPVAPPAAPQQQTAPGGHDAALAILFQAAGLGAPPPGIDAAAALTAAGAALRASVAGMRALLIARADVKREFRIEQTMLRAAGNNPVKFAATDDQAMLALLSPNSRGPAALAETVTDLTAHQIATLAATQAAARALLTRLAPGPIEADTPSGGIMPGAKEKALWAAYKKLHQQVIDQFEDDFDSAFGKAFARAYEEAARSG